MWDEYDRLRDRHQRGVLTPAEHAELIRLTDVVEQYQADRAAALMCESAEQVARVGADCERITEPLYGDYQARYRDGGTLGAATWLADLRPDLRNLFTAHACWIDAGCGGFGVFYTTSHGALATEAVVGLRALGLPKCASLVAEANRFFGPSVPRDRQARLRLIESGGIFSDGQVDRSLCRVGYRDVAHSPDWEYRREWDFAELDCLLWAAFEEETPAGFLVVADRYARQIRIEQSAALAPPAGGVSDALGIPPAG